MGVLGKVIIGAAIGVGAIAAAPITGGGSLLAGATLAEALAGAEVAAVGAGVIGAGVGAIASEIEEDDAMNEIKQAKEQAFQDGINEGKFLTKDEIGKYVNFYLASTALAFYTARCDGNISLEEKLEIDYDMDAIKKNVDISDGVKNKIEEIAQNEHLTWGEVETYLDKVGIDTLQRLGNDVLEIVKADGVIMPEEEKVLEDFRKYLVTRDNYSEIGEKSV